jgi:hypothetical protein
MTAQDTNTIVLSDLIGNCPFKIECSPYCEIVSNETDAWLVSHDISNLESMTQFNLLWALIYPHANRTRLRNISDARTLIFIADDLVDTSYGKNNNDPAKQQLSKNMIEYLQPAGSFKPLTLFASALYDWWQRMLVTATLRCQQRFINAY